MSKAASLRLVDVRNLIRLVGECRDLGRDPIAWRQHALARLARMVGAELAMSGEIAGWRSGHAHNLAITEWGWENGFNKRVFEEIFHEFGDAPARGAPMEIYLSKVPCGAGACLSRRDLIRDQEWEQSPFNQTFQRNIGVDHSLVCFLPLPGTADEFCGQTFSREVATRRDFGQRERTLAREGLRALTELVGGALSRLAEPSPATLPPRVRQVLERLLRGDGDKQIAMRLGISRFTVNQYVKAIFQHFGVQSRGELLARWIPRGPRG